jgi:drug/metabolite transporter (DMT)-like permease
MRTSIAAPHVALLLVQIMFGTWPIIGKIALRQLPSTGIVLFRVAGAALAFFVIRRLMPGSNERRKVSGARDFLQLALLSLLGVVLNQFLFVKGLELSTVINATLLGVAIPVWTLIVSLLLGRERLAFSTTAGIVLAMLGVIYLVDPARADFSGATTLGNILLISNTAAYGAYIALSQNIIQRYGALTVISWIFLFGCIAAIPVGGYHLAQIPLSETSGNVWLAIIYIILVPTVGAYYLNAWALGRVNPSTVAAYVYLQPLIAFALAPFVLGERLTGRTWLAAALIFAGVAVTSLRLRTSRRDAKQVAEYHLSSSGG